MISKDEILVAFELLQYGGESQEIEAKRASAGIGDSVMQTVCAFANEPHIGHGLLLLGIAEPDDSHDDYWVCGVEDVDNLFNQLQGNCRTQFTMPVKIDAGVAQIDGKQVIAVKVFELDAAAKPCAFKSGGKKNKNASKTGIWRRGINGDYEASVDELGDILAAKSGQSFENVVLPDASWADIDTDVIEEYRRLRAKINPDAAELSYDDVALLESFHLLKRDGGDVRPNVAGLLLFGSAAALRKYLPMARVDYMRHAGQHWVEDSDRRFLYSRDFREPLIHMIPRIEAMVLDDLPEHFHLPDNALQRADRPFLPQRVVREAVVNMVMHRDYRANQPSQINRFRDRLEMENAGFSLKPIERMGSPTSEARNPLIAAVLYDLRFAETKGTGVNIMREKLKQAGLTAPAFSSDRTRNQFRATFLLHQLMDDAQLQWLERFAQYSLSNEAATALVLAKDTDMVDNSSLREITGLDTLAASRVLSRLCQDGLLEKNGASRATFYCLTAYAREMPKPLHYAGNLDDKPTDLSTNTSDLSANASDLSTNTSDLSTNTSDLSTNTSDLSTNTSDLPPSLTAKITTLGKKPRKTAIYPIIIWLCSLRPYTAEELAQQLNRQVTAFKTAYLNPLREKEKLIAYTYPEVINHPNQAYQTTRKGIEWLQSQGIEL